MTESSSSSIPKTTTQPPQPKLRLPWRTRLSLTLISTVSDQARRHDFSINRRLLNFFDFKSSTTPSSSFDFTVDPSRNLWCRLYSPKTPSETEHPLPVVVFFHGGGFSYLSAASFAYDVVCKRLANNLGSYVVSVNYRLTPEHKFPSQYDDGFDVLKFFHDCQSSYENAKGSGEEMGAVREIVRKRFDLSKCFLAGDSAGANIAHHVAVRTCRIGFQNVKLMGLISIQPFFGGEERTDSELKFINAPLISVNKTDWHWKVFLPEGSNRDHYAVNVSGPNAEDITGLDGFPEVMVVVGGFDPLKDWQRRYYEWLKRSNKEAILIEYPNMIHAFYIFPELKESSELISQIKDFIVKRVSKL